MDNYLQILEDSLHKKIAVLQHIEAMNKEQQLLLQAENVDMDAFDATIDQKGEQIEILNRLDEGFDTLYNQIREQLLAGKEKHREQIQRLQKLITEVTEKSVSVQTQEARNKKLAESYFSSMKKEVKQSRMNAKAALGYYKNVSKAGVVNSRFLDEKN